MCQSIAVDTVGWGYFGLVAQRLGGLGFGQIADSPKSLKPAS